MLKRAGEKRRRTIASDLAELADGWRTYKISLGLFFDPYRGQRFQAETDADPGWASFLAVDRPSMAEERLRRREVP